MSFEDEIIAFILKICPEAQICPPNAQIEHIPQLISKSVHISDKKIVFNLLPLSFVAATPDYLQKKSLEYASLGFQLVHIWQDCWKTKQENVCSRIAAMLGVYKRIHARQTNVSRVSKGVASEFFETNHLQGYANARYHYGLFSNGILVAAASFSAGRKMMRNSKITKSYELVRYSNLLNHRVAGVMGKLIARFVKDIKPDDIMTYADLDWASGNSYKTLNFKQIAITPPQVFQIHPSEMIRYYPHRLPQKIVDNFNMQCKHGNIDDFLKEMGYVKIYNAGNLKYLLV